MTPTLCVLVALGGALGAVLRFVVDAQIKSRSRSVWPLSTFVINVLGSCALGVSAASGWPLGVTTFLGTGVCGGFTTFSTASVETVSLLRARRGGLAVSYAFVSLLACWAACALGGLA